MLDGKQVTRAAVTAADASATATAAAAAATPSNGHDRTSARATPRTTTATPLPASMSAGGTDVGPVELDNLSFTSHISNLGHGQGAAADLYSMAAAAADEDLSNAAVGSIAGDGVGVGGGGSAMGAAGASAQQQQQTTTAMTTTFEPVSTTVKRFLVTGYPLTLSTLAQFSLNVVIIATIGQMLGPAALGGATLALGLVNATGFAFGAGLCGALETVLSHAYGKFRAEQAAAAAGGGATAPTTVHIYGVYAQRMAVILFVAAFPLGLLLAFADALLLQMGENPVVMHYTGQWCHYAIFGIPAALLYQLMQRYYSCQYLTKPLSVAMLVAAVANPIMQVVFIKLFGFAGSPIAWLLIMICIVAALIVYLWRTGKYKRTWGGLSDSGLRELRSLLDIALPSMGVMLSEWVALEINALAGGFAPANDLAAYSITMQIFGVLWGISSGVIILTCVFVGNAIGAGNPMQARRTAFIAIGLVLALSIVNVILALMLNSTLPYLFTSDDDVAERYQNLMYVVLPYHIFDAFQSTVMGIFRGCKLQKLGAILITVAFAVIGVPVSFLLFFYFDIGIKALWIGPFIGVGGVGFPVYVYVLLYYIDWASLRPHKERERAPAMRAEDMVVEGDEAAAATTTTASRVRTAV